MDTLFIIFTGSLEVDFYYIDEYSSWACTNPISVVKDVFDHLYKANWVITLKSYSKLITTSKQVNKYFMMWALLPLLTEL